MTDDSSDNKNKGTDDKGTHKPQPTTAIVDPSKIQDPDLKSAIQILLEKNARLEEEAAAQKKYREEQIKRESDLKLKEYNIEREKNIEILKSIDPKLAETHKESHNDTIKIAIETAKLITGKLPDLKTGADKKDSKPAVFYGYDNINKKNPYK